MTTRAEAIAAAGEVYGAILADPERRAQLLAARARRASQTTGSSDARGGVARRTGSNQQK